MSLKLVFQLEILKRTMKNWIKAEAFPTLAEGALPHWELAKKYDLIDFDLGSKITGAGFPVLQRKRSAFTTCLNQLFFR